VFDRPTPFVVPFTGSNHTASRQWMGTMNRKMIPGTEDPAPSYGFIYRMKTAFKTNDQGDWFMWEVEDENGEPTIVTDPLVYKMARKIESDFSKGTLRAAKPDLENSDTAASGGGGGNSETSKHI